MSAPEIVIVVGEERATLFAALTDLDHAAQEWKPQAKSAAYNHAVAAFDAMRERLANEQPVGCVPAELVERIRSLVDHYERRRWLAAPVELSDLKALLKAIDAARAAEPIATGGGA